MLYLEKSGNPGFMPRVRKLQKSKKLGCFKDKHNMLQWNSLDFIVSVLQFGNWLLIKTPDMLVNMLG
jgi:hypothetical protein